MRNRSRGLQSQDWLGAWLGDDRAMDAGLEILDEGGEQGGGGRRGEEVPRVDRALAVAGVADQALGAEQEAEVEEQQALRSQPTCKMVVVVGELDGASVGGVVLGRGSGFGVGEVGLPGGNGELGAAEEERRRAKLGDAVVWRGADAGRVSVNADCSTAKQAHCTRFANRDSFFAGLWLSHVRAPWLCQRTCGGGSRFCGCEPLLHRAGADGGEPGSSGAWGKLGAHRKLVPPAHRTASWGFLGWALGCRMEQSA